MNLYYDARREHGSISIHLLRNSPPPDEVPYELRGHISQDDWSTRLPKIKSTAYQFYKPLFEKLWLFSAFLSIIVVPLVTYYFLLDTLVHSNSRRSKYDRVLQARAIGFGIFVGTLLFFFVPYFTWKMIGRRRMAKLLEGWAVADQARRNPSPGGYVPRWKVKSPSVFKSSAILTITTPPNLQPTYFHPNAYLPSFINPPPDGYTGTPDAPAGYYYTYAPPPNQYGVPRMGVAPGGLPAYDGNVVGVQRYDDVKVPV